MKTLFSILFFCLLLFSCGKKRTIHITATNAATGQRISGLPFNVFSSYTGSNGQKYKTVESGVLNSQGEATISLRQIPNKSYCVKVDEPSNTCYNKVITMYFDSPNDENGHFNFEFAECAYLKLNVHNTNCIDVNDFIKFRRLWVSGNTGNNFVEQFGCFQFDGDYFKLPMGEYKYEWSVTKNGITNNYDSNFQLTENQYYDFNINY